jgi:hypothetical protein
LPVSLWNYEFQKIAPEMGWRSPVFSSLLDDIGVAMAMVIARVLPKGWMPNGYRQEDGMRIFR